MAIYLFGSSIQTSVLDNFQAERSVGGATILLVYLIVLICHIPYIFMFCKEAGCSLFDEVLTSKISTAISNKLAGYVQETDSK